MEKVEASLNIELNVECPHCEEYFDLFKLDDGRLDDDGQLMKAACPNGFWAESHEKFKETVNCPECGQSINIERIAW